MLSLNTMKPVQIENRKAHFEYQILEKFEAGLVLSGPEVRSIKLGRMNLAGSYVVIQGGEAWLLNASIPPYQPTNLPGGYNAGRSRKLLLKKQEIQYLQGKIQQKGLTLVPLKVYTKKAKIKLEFAICKGKKLHDKRESIKERDWQLERSRSFKDF